ncbi:MAG: hypothetical protein OXB94_12325 [Nitrospira sp.]|nr:hypothetical protein [Nitrospira sp.]
MLAGLAVGYRLGSFNRRLPVPRRQASERCDGADATAARSGGDPFA